MHRKFLLMNIADSKFHQSNIYLDCKYEPSLSMGSERLALGTAQFGLPYGVSNMLGQTSYDNVATMVAVARTANIDTLDTAVAYGEAETILGRVGVSDFRVISKVPAIHKSVNAADDFIVAQVEASLARLDISRLGGLMLHAPGDLLGPHGSQIVRGLRRVKDLGLVERIGLSVYSPEQLFALIHLLPVEILQIPLNVFDRRFADSGLLDRLARDGVEVHARSVFLQGLLLLPVEDVPPKFAPFRTLLDNWHSWLSGISASSSPVQACLAHVASYSGLARIVVGAENPGQLQEIISAATSRPLRAPGALASPASSLINPSEWRTL